MSSKAMLLIIVSLLLSGCLSMGAKIEVEKILEEREHQWVLRAESAARKISNERTQEMIEDRLPGMVNQRAREISGDRAQEILDARIPSAVTAQLATMGITRDFVVGTQEELDKVDWAGIVTGALTLLLGGVVANDKVKSRKKKEDNGE
jgi:argonaute-like protein implicated in RNA metabolism and viral defense